MALLDEILEVKRVGITEHICIRTRRKMCSLEEHAVLELCGLQSLAQTRMGPDFAQWVWFS